MQSLKLFGSRLQETDQQSKKTMAAFLEFFTFSPSAYRNAYEEVEQDQDDMRSM
jgi:hypothetical protein